MDFIYLYKRRSTTNH